MWINRQLRLKRERFTWKKIHFALMMMKNGKGTIKLRVSFLLQNMERGIATLHATWSEAYPI